MASKQRKLASPGMAGFIVPPFSLTLDTASVTESSAQGTDIGTLTFTPPDAAITLIDSDGGKFQLNGNVLECGAVALNADDDVAAEVNVRISKNTYIFEKTFAITVNAAPVTAINLSGSQTYVEGAAEGDPIGTLTSTPDGATFSIQTQTPANGVTLVGDEMQVGSAGAALVANDTIALTIRATRDGKTFDEDFTITVMPAV